MAQWCHWRSEAITICAPSVSHASHCRVHEFYTLASSPSFLNYKYSTRKYVIWRPSSDLFPFAHYCTDHMERRTKLNRQTGYVRHSCNRCFLFQLFLNIVFSVLLPWMAFERPRWCTSSIFQQAGRHTGST